jgi:molybdopterin converting factor small subunit
MPPVRVHILIKGRIGDGWYDVDRTLKVDDGTTLGQLVSIAGARGVPLASALADSPHLAHTLMWNGDRCPLDENRNRTISDGDEIYLLAPLAGG